MGTRTLACRFSLIGLLLDWAVRSPLKGGLVYLVGVGIVPALSFLLDAFYLPVYCIIFVG